MSSMPLALTSATDSKTGSAGSRSDPSRGARVIRVDRERPKHDSVLSGQLEQLNLFSVLQALGANDCNGNMIIHGTPQDGVIYIEKGQLIYVSLGGYKGPKAFYRLVGVNVGSFEFFSPGRQPAERNMAGSLEGHLLEAARHLDELADQRAELPHGPTRLRFNPNTIAKVAKIPYPTLEVMVAIHKYETVSGALDGCGLPDLDVCRIIASLLHTKVIQIEEE